MLEARRVLTTTLYFDFGAGIGAGNVLSEQVGNFRDIFGPGLNNNGTGSNLVGRGNLQANDSFDFRPLAYDFNGDGTFTDADITALQDAVLPIIERAMEPFDIEVVAAAATSFADAVASVEANDGDPDGEHDAYNFVMEVFSDRFNDAAGDSFGNLAGELDDDDPWRHAISPAAVTADDAGFGDGTADGSVGFNTGLFGVAAADDLFAQNGNLQDEATLTFTDVIFNFTGGTPGTAAFNQNLATRIAYTAAHEAFHTLTFVHTTGTTDNRELLSSGDVIRLGSVTREDPFKVTRFDLDRQGGFNVDEPNNYLQTANDPDIGLVDRNDNGIPDFAYVTGTGANDRITLTAGTGTVVNVEVEAFADAAKSILIDSETYTIDLATEAEGEILIDAGINADEIIIDGNIAADFRVRGGTGIDGGAEDDSITIENLPFTATPSGPTSGTITYGAQTVAYSEIERIDSSEPGSVAGTHFEDINANGQQEAFEPGLPGWIFYVDLDEDGQFDADEPSALTDADGEFQIDDVPSGVQLVGRLPQPGFSQSTQQAVAPIGFQRVNVVGGALVDGIDFGGVWTAGYDLGDAPDTYDSRLASDGPVHRVNSTQRLGNFIDSDADNLLLNFFGDDNTGVKDEDGVTFTSPIQGNLPASFDVAATTAGTLAAWVDFNADGSFDNATERFEFEIPASGTHSFEFDVPGDAVVGSSAARFRFAIDASEVQQPGGFARSGEVEDMAVVIETAAPINLPPLIDDQSFELAEGSLVGTVVGTVIATEPDLGQTLTYTITAGDDAGFFAIDAATGQLTVDAAGLDFETEPVFELTVQVVDDGPPFPQSAAATVTVNLLNVFEVNPGALQAFAPLYQYPLSAPATPNDWWQRVVDSASEIDPITVVVNPANGPIDPAVGGAAYDDYIEGLTFLRSNPNVRILGYIATDFGNTDLPSIEEQIGWYAEGYKHAGNGGSLIDGIFFDEMSSDAGDVDRYADFAQAVRDATGLAGHLVTGNPGVALPESFLTAGTADLLIVAEDSGENFDPATLPGYVTDPAYDHLAFGAVLHAVFPPEGEADFLREIKFAGLDFAFLTDDTLDPPTENPYDSAPRYFESFMQNVHAPFVASATVSIAENSPEGQRVATLAAGDPDSGDSLSFAILDGNIEDAFAIDDAGQITVNNRLPLDFETRQSFELLIEVTDDSPRTLTDVATLTVLLDDVDDGPAQLDFDFGQANSPVAEGFIGITNPGTYDPNLGYGWTSPLNESFDTASGDDLQRDYQFFRTGTRQFVADVYNGEYDVQVVIGSTLHRFANVDIQVEGASVANVTTQPGEFHVATYRTTVDDGQLEVALERMGGTIVGLNALSITQVAVTSNLPPTDLLLENVVTELAENTNTDQAIAIADLAVVDDGLGTNELSITGPDANLFEIENNQLLLVAGAVLDQGANPSLDITLTVDDVTVGNTPDVSRDLSITVTAATTNLPPTDVTLTSPLDVVVETTDLSAGLKVADIEITDDGLGSNQLDVTGPNADLFEIVNNELRLVAGTVLDAAVTPQLQVTVEVDDTSVGTTPDASVDYALSVQSAPDFQFDFGRPNSPVQDGFTQVTTPGLYSASTGFGWSTAVYESFDTGAADDLTRDYHFFRTGQRDFVVDAEDGDYEVEIVIGSTLHRFRGVGIAINGTPVDEVSTEPGEFRTLTYSAVVAGGQLTVTISREAGTFVAINSLRLTQLAPAVNMPPTGVQIDNAVTELPENVNTSSPVKLGDLSVIDDALGQNNLTLEGADAALLEIVDEQLFLKAGVTLDASSNPSLDFEVLVDDPTVGTTPDASTSGSVEVLPASTNLAPTAVTLSNTVTEIGQSTPTVEPIKVADIRITDDGIGTNELSLSGPDEPLFELIGNELFLRAGVTLDAQAQPLLQVTVAVDDVTVGATPDATADLLINVVGDPLYRFDFGRPNGSVAPDQIGLATPASYDVATGYGWIDSVFESFDTGEGDALRRDYHFFRTGARTFAVDLEDGTYDVSLTIGSTLHRFHQAGILINGEDMETVTTLPGEFHEATYRVQVTGGQLQLTLERRGGTFIAINGLAITKI